MYYYQLTFFTFFPALFFFLLPEEIYCYIYKSSTSFYTISSPLLPELLFDLFFSSSGEFCFDFFGETLGVIIASSYGENE